METEVAWGPLPSSGQSCLPIQPSVGEEAVQEMDGDSGRGEVRLRRSPPQKQGWAGGTGRCSWEETGQGRGEPCTGDLGSDWIREEPVLGIAPAQPSCETLAKGQLPPFLDLVKA